LNHCLTQQQTDESMKWLFDSVTTGQMPCERVDETDVNLTIDEKRGRWGPPVTMGATGLKGDFFLMEEETNVSVSDFWALPKDLESRVTEHRRGDRKEDEDFNTIPNVRYKGVSVKRAKQMQAEAAEIAEATFPEKPRIVDDDLSQSSDSDSITETWGVNVSECYENSFVVCRTLFFDPTKKVNEKGITVMKVISKREDDNEKGKWFIKGDDYGTIKKSSDVGCLLGAYFPKKTQTEVESWSVCGTFAALDKSKIPRNIQKIVMDQHNTVEGGLFTDALEKIT
jgi:hypothetical protein